MAKRRAGGVAIIDRSRIPLMAMLSVRGIGVAVRVRISTSARIALTFSFWRTPKRCSSSTISKPRSAKRISLESNLWVPTRMSTLPSATSCRICFCSLADLKRESTSTRIGKLAKRSRKFSKCCWASSVVGTNTATCLPLSVATNAARIATSVFPKPTSPHTKRSMALA
ncbi:Uncharacterised protein [Vibrio cholerae]|uniref:Uncharacterized protein n=1 Tax=Vibrio cholerae TaxID=666 RepID=A0A655XFZ4_VIBCL|nr:Uncharacterised protein [Vibrio cholerae]CRZ74597.1 Uncharacterised protein [Vibrio cholerae]CRZ83648.1 Uncharacterised protein [Vibrio cholerae]CSA20193.1 Uncharacterised protein [Vibrio cholerae]CSB78031.1 Uncharacterised protein [Vibrio cholerae]